MLLAKTSCARIGVLLAAGPTLTEIVTAKSSAVRKQVADKLQDLNLALDAATQILSHDRLLNPDEASKTALAQLLGSLAGYQVHLDDLTSRAQERFSTPVDPEWRSQRLTHQQTRDLVRDLQDEFRPAFWGKLFEFPLGRRRHMEAILDVDRRGLTNNHHFLADQGDASLMAGVKKLAVQIARSLAEVAPDPFASLDEATSSKIATLLCMLPPKPEKALSVSKEIEAKVGELIELETTSQAESYGCSTTPEARENAAARIRELQQELGGTALVARRHLKQLLASREPYIAIKDYVFLANAPLVSSLFRNWQPKGFDEQDLRQAANIGLLKAIERFDLTRGTSFATCAFIWMRQAVNSFVRDTGDVVYVPPYLGKALQEIRTNASPKTHQMDTAELATQLEISPDQARALLRISARVYRVHGSADEESSGGAIASPFASPEANAQMRDLSEVIMKRLLKLPERERIIIQSRFGIQKERTHTLEELSVMFGVSLERIRQIEAKALGILGSAKTAASLVSLRDAL
jgi:RNA polymerase sigma factor (sigma-70 family)